MEASAETTEAPPQTLLGRAEVWLIFIVLGAMIVLPTSSVIARLIRQEAPAGMGEFVQHLTIWAGFVGALIATGAHSQLALATNELLPEGNVRLGVHFFQRTVTAAVTAMLAYASIVMIQADSLNGVKIFQLVPAWWSELIMPVALGLMAARSAFSASPRWSLRILSFVLVAATFALDQFADHSGALRLPLVVLVLLAVILGAPIYVALCGLAMALFFADGTPIATVPSELSRLVESPTLPAIPLLTLCGFLLAEGGASRRLLRAARSCIGFLPGGIAMMVIVVCAAFTTLTGGSGVTIIALGGLVMPILIEEGYPPDFSLGLVTAAGSLGLLFFPSLPVILYSVVAEVPAGQLYWSGLLPGLLLVVIVMAYGFVVGRRAETKRQKFSVTELRAALWEAKWELAVPVILLVAFISGKATIVEAAALATALAFIVEVFVFKDLRWPNEVLHVFSSAGRLMGAVIIVLGTAMGLTSYLVDAEIPARLLGWVTANVHSQMVFLLALNVILLVLGSVLEIYSAIVILAPLLVPMGLAFKVDPVHLGIIFLANLELGFLFPPVGLNLLLSSSRFKVPLPRVYRVAFPFLLILAGGVLVITYLPWLTLRPR